MRMRIRLTIGLLLLAGISSVYAQKPILPGGKGDEQGIEIPGDIKLQQDKDAIREAYKGWWTESMKTHDERMAWYKEARFGCFIHWGVSSPAGNEWKGTNQRYPWRDH